MNALLGKDYLTNDKLLLNWQTLSLEIKHMYSIEQLHRKEVPKDLQKKKLKKGKTAAFQ
jgi:hypothetical protein